MSYIKSCHCFFLSFAGSPVKAEQLATKSRAVRLEDPRPLHLRNLPGYNDYVRSCVVNYCCSSGNDLAMRYLYEKADLSAAVHDHRYMTTPFTEFWVDSALQVVACCSIVANSPFTMGSRIFIYA